MTTNPFRLHVMNLQQFIQTPPEINIPHVISTLRRLSPSIPLPSRHPIGDRRDDVLAVAEQFHTAFFLKRLQSSNHRCDFHPIVGRAMFAAAVFLGLPAPFVLENVRPTAGAGVVDTRTIGEEADLWSFFLTVALFSHAVYSH
jgi:hypothetical protein